jgi:hypothetical protein
MKRPLLLAPLFFLFTVANAAADTPARSYVDLADAPSITVDWSQGNTQAVTLHGNRILSFANGQKGGRYLLIVKQDTTGSRIVIWPSSVHWPGGDHTQPPTLTATANKKDYISFFCDGVTYDLVAISQNL